MWNQIQRQGNVAVITTLSFDPVYTDLSNLCKAVDADNLEKTDVIEWLIF